MNMQRERGNDMPHANQNFRTYFIVASKMVRPGQLYRVSVTVLQEKQPLTVRASISRNGVEMSTDYKAVKEGIPETLLMRVRYNFVCNYEY